MSRSAPLRAVLWDFDGTLIDSSPIHREAFDVLYAELGIPPVPYESIAGQTTRKVFTDFGLTGDDLDRAVTRKQTLAREKLKTAPILFEGADRVLRLLSERGLRQAIVSGASPESVEIVCRRYGLDRFLDTMVCAGQSSEAKPHPSPFLEACARLDVFPGEALAIEDAGSGARSALAAGVPLWTVHADDEVARTADRAFESLAALERAFGTELEGLTRSASPVAFVGDSAPSGRDMGCVAVIPAAGRGTRLGADGPKILYEIAGAPILEHLSRALAPAVGAIVVVASPEGREPIAAAARDLALDVEVVVQPEPVGMADAVWRARDSAAARAAERLLIVWGDQVTLQRDTVAALLAARAAARADAAFPTHVVAEPYIHFGRDTDGRLAHVRQRREGDSMPARGENDCGVFLVENRGFFERLASFSSDTRHRGAETGEVSFLPFLVDPAGDFDTVLTVRGIDPRETVGVNTTTEAEAAADFLRQIGT